MSGNNLIQAISFINTVTGLNNRLNISKCQCSPLGKVSETRSWQPFNVFFGLFFSLSKEFIWCHVCDASQRVTGVTFPMGFVTAWRTLKMSAAAKVLQNEPRNYRSGCDYFHIEVGDAILPHSLCRRGWGVARKGRAAPKNGNKVTQQPPVTIWRASLSQCGCSFFFSSIFFPPSLSHMQQPPFLFWKFSEKDKLFLYFMLIF